ncbi:MAG: trypsin-like peptidase domain-containing protein, partial [Oscillospiraceae bacterium]|nr:trypsin-like peptidase domain-containing protein [Oscillospiraceae bacterium]
MYEDENNLYHYSYRKGNEYDPNVPIDTKNYADEPSDQNRGSGSGKKKGAAKIVALALVCALVGGLVGAGASSAAAKVNHTSVQISDREVAQVQTVKVDGKTQMTMPEVYASNVNSVVSINVSATTNYFGQTVQTAASGTGFFITEDGYILTNHHVISGASSVKVTLYNGETYDATVIGSDEDYDIAVLKIDVTGATPVVLGDSSKIAIGESVAAVGNPLGELTFSMSEGIVSCVNRAINVDGTPFNMIQVDCSINPGNSGGPLFNSYGEVIGIVSAKYSSYSNTTVEGIGFAIPINDVVSLVKDIMTNGYVTNKAYMGITPQTMTAQMAQQYRYDVTEGV